MNISVQISGTRLKIEDKLWPTVYDGGLNRVYSTQWRPHSSNRFAKWLAAVNPFSLPHKWDHHTSRWRFQHKISITARVQLLADRPCSPNPLLDIFSWKAYRTAEKLNSTMIYSSLIHHPCNTHDCIFFVAPAVIHLNQDQKGDDSNHTANNPQPSHH